MRRTPLTPTAFALTVALLFIGVEFGSLVSPVSAIGGGGAGVICARIPGLTLRQRDMCRASPNALVAVGDGMSLGIRECQHQFRHHRWNCTAIGSENVFGHVIVVASREAAYTYAVTSAAVTYAVSDACARGNISTCGCDQGHRGRGGRTVDTQLLAPAGWKWGGCSVDVGYGMRFARRFLDAREIEGDARSLMNLHNNKAGRKVVKQSLRINCKCHGVSGSCTLRTCWKVLPPFRVIGDNLMKKYNKARQVLATTNIVPDRRRIETPRRPRKLHLELKKSSSAQQRIPRKSELVYLDIPPNYCEKNLSVGSLGTVGRLCNRTSLDTGGCDLLCCGRGYNTHQYTRTWQCNCKFHWCCFVKCDTCSERTEEYTCK